MKTVQLLLIILSLVFLSSCECEERADWLRKNVTGTSYRKIVARKYLDPDGRYQPVFISEDSEKYEFYNMNAYDMAEPGDSIIKTAGTLKHILKKKDTVVSFYPTCKFQEIKDR
jgi:hypothetical protein